jgi:hypothetical protein
MTRALSSIALCLVLGCGESFVPAWAVTDLRAVAAPVEVDGKPGRARPDPGDGVEVSVLVVDEGAPASEVPALTPPPLQWTFVACVPQPTLIGPPICRDVIQPCDGCEGAPPPDPLTLPVLRFQVPSTAELEAAGADRVLLQGVICADGPPATDAILRFILGETDDLTPCEDPSDEGRFVTVNIPIESTPEDPNLNPEISTVFLNGRPWPPPYDQAVPRSAPRTGCRADLDGLTEEQRNAHPVASSAASSIELGVTPESLQAYMVGDVALTEEMQVSWLTDGGDLERTFSFITDPARSVLTLWLPFPAAPEDGLLVRLTFVIRDGRGGSDWVQRGLCVLPPPPGAPPP